jgi:hypothetical protein
VLLPEVLWPRRADAAEVIGAGLEIAALGRGHRQVAAHLGLSDGTVRGWIRRFVIGRRLSVGTSPSLWLRSQTIR